MLLVAAFGFVCLLCFVEFCVSGICGVVCLGVCFFWVCEIVFTFVWVCFGICFV